MSDQTESMKVFIYSACYATNSSLTISELYVVPKLGHCPAMKLAEQPSIELFLP